MLGMIGEWERETIIERTKAGRLQRYKEGRWGPGNPPYGYDYDRKNTKKLVINEAEASIIRRIFQEYSTGKSMTYIANMLNGDLIPPRGKRGKGWRNGSIRDVVFNPAYKGTQVVNVYQQYSRLPKEIPDSAIYIEVPAIVEETLWNIAQERRKSNKHLKPPREGHWLLQGLITCGLCGYTFRTEMPHGKRGYGCRGRLKYTHIDGSPRCTSPRLDAEWLEQQVWSRIEAIINDPNRLESLLRETIESLRNKEIELGARIQPIEQRLAQIAQQKARLADEWVQTNMDTQKYSELKLSLDQEEVRLRSVKSEIDPAQLEELEHTRSMLQFWQRQIQSMAWNTENEDGSMVRVVDKPHETVLKIVGIEDDDVSKALFFPATKKKMLDKFQVRVVVFIDRVEVKAIFPIEPIDCQDIRPDSK
jgi:site-specific DNA recombinase